MTLLPSVHRFINSIVSHSITLDTTTTAIVVNNKSGLSPALITSRPTCLAVFVRRRFGLETQTTIVNAHTRENFRVYLRLHTL
eukprot:m.162834 g.162834  ORF g.162834 m.162834 type:complete len:83 (-) comp31278_c1_seq45:1379-1627(-)